MYIFVWRFQGLGEVRLFVLDPLQGPVFDVLGSVSSTPALSSYPFVIDDEKTYLERAVPA